jgi:hypothetical protein
MHRWAKPLLFAFFADGATQNNLSVSFIIPRKRSLLAASTTSCTPTENRGSEACNGEIGDFCGLLWFLFEKNRIKCGENAVFPQQC